jgi:DNA-directed RNA polymerase subunit H (RpoH/RPB5)
MSEREIERAMRNIATMLETRGYVAVGDHGLYERRALAFAGAETAEERVRAVVVKTDKLSANTARESAAIALAHDARVLVILAAAGPTAPVRLVLTELERGGDITIEAFTHAEMQINILEHVLQPSFGVLSECEVRTLLAEHKVKLTQLPRILSSDPCARYLGLRRGAVLCITRRPPGANEIRTYRVVT